MIHVDTVLSTAIAAVYDDKVPFPEKRTYVTGDLHTIEITHVRICVDPYVVAAPPGLLGHARHIDLTAAWVWGIAVDDEEEANACVYACLVAYLIACLIHCAPHHTHQHEHDRHVFKSFFRAYM